MTALTGVLYWRYSPIKHADKRVAFPALIGDKYMLEGRSLPITVCAAGAGLGREFGLSSLLRTTPCLNQLFAVGVFGAI